MYFSFLQEKEKYQNLPAAYLSVDKAGRESPALCSIAPLNKGIALRLNQPALFGWVGLVILAMIASIWLLVLV